MGLQLQVKISGLALWAQSLSGLDSDGSHQEPQVRKFSLQKSGTSQVCRGAGLVSKKDLVTFF